jgi:5-methylcytosine-specific restriction protein B
MDKFGENQKRLEKQSEWLQIFLQHVRERTIDTHVRYDEGYKFESVDHFLRHINLEASDLAANLDEAIPTNNLVAASMYFPKKMLLIYAQQFPEETRNILFNLYDESRDVAERIDITKHAFEDLEETRAKTLGRHKDNTYIGLRFISLLLGYRFPEKYNALKPAEWRVFARFINPDFSIPHKTPPGKQYEIYNEYNEP